MALSNAVSMEVPSMDELSQGYMATTLMLDKGQLISDFYGLIESSSTGKRMLNNLACLVLVQDDQLQIYNTNTKNWTPPFFFTIKKNTKIYYVNMKTDIVYWYENGIKNYSTLSAAGISEFDKAEAVTSQLNEKVKSHLGDADSFDIKIKNMYNTSKEYKASYNSINPLDGITFFGVYKDHLYNLNIFSKNRISIYSVSGYTLDFKDEGLTN